MNQCKHEFRTLSNMKGARADDGSFYCVPGYKWCHKCGGLSESRQENPYKDVKIKHIAVTEPKERKTK